MHYLAFALIPDEGDPKEHVTQLFAPHAEQTSGNGWWDWWVIGGRWTGHLDGYEPDKDPANHETCHLCDGTGKRDDELGRRMRRENPAYTCNGCQGAGRAVKRPTAWDKHPGDVQPAAQVLALIEADKSKTPYTLIDKDGAIRVGTWDGHGFVETPNWHATVLARLKAHRGRVVVVDYHS